MGLFDGIIGAEAPAPTTIIDTLPVVPVGGTTGSSGGGTGDDGSAPVIVDQATPPLIIASDTDTEGDGDSLIIHSESEMDAIHNTVDFDIGMPEIIAKNPETITVSPEILPEVDMKTPASLSLESFAIGSPDPAPSLISDTSDQATLEDRIAGFVADLEKLKSDDEMLLHEKEAAIEKLETEMKEITKEIKKIQADEKRIDATITSINAPVAKGK